MQFAKDDRKIKVMDPYLEKAAASGRSQIAAIGVAQEFQRVFIARKRDTDPTLAPQFSFDKTDRRVTCYYVYVWDDDFGPGFIKSYASDCTSVCLIERNCRLRRVRCQSHFKGHSSEARRVGHHGRRRRSP